MLTEHYFADADQDKFNAYQKRFKKRSIWIFLVFSLVSGGVWCFLVASQDRSYLPYAIGVELLFLLLLFFFLMKINSLIRKDQSEQIKLMGEVKVVSKSKKNNETSVYFDAEEFKQMSFSKAVFDKINIGDVLMIELAKNSKFTFRVDRAGESLMSAG